MFIQVILVIVILAAMVMLLLGIDHLFTGHFSSDNEEASELREDVEKRKDVITSNNIFRSLVEGSDPEVERMLSKSPVHKKSHRGHDLWR